MTFLYVFFSGVVNAVVNTMASISRLIFPLWCAGCGRLDTPLCPGCSEKFAGQWKDVSAHAPYLLHVEATGQERPFFPVMSLGVYKGVRKAAIIRWKNTNNTALTKRITHILRWRARALIGAEGFARQTSIFAGNNARRITRPIVNTPKVDLCKSGIPVKNVAVKQNISRHAYTISGETTGSEEAFITKSMDSGVLIIPAPTGKKRRREGRLVATFAAHAVSEAWGGGVACLDILRKTEMGIGEKIWRHVTHMCQKLGLVGVGVREDNQHARGRKSQGIYCDSKKIQMLEGMADSGRVCAIIVDDVCTTGATLAGCMRTLATQGITVCGAIVLAHAVNPHEIRERDKET